MLSPSIDYGYAKTLEGTQLRSGYYQPDNAIGYCHISNVMHHGQDYVYSTYIGIEKNEYWLIQRYESQAFDFIPPMKKGDSVVVHNPEACRTIHKEFRSGDSTGGHVGLNTNMAYIHHTYDNGLYEWDSKHVLWTIEQMMSSLGYALGKCKEKAEQEYEAKKQKAEDERHDWKHDESLIL